MTGGLLSSPAQRRVARAIRSGRRSRLQRVVAGRVEISAPRRVDRVAGRATLALWSLQNDMLSLRQAARAYGVDGLLVREFLAKLVDAHAAGLFHQTVSRQLGLFLLKRRLCQKKFRELRLQARIRELRVLELRRQVFYGRLDPIVFRRLRIAQKTCDFLCEAEGTFGSTRSLLRDVDKIGDMVQVEVHHRNDVRRFVRSQSRGAA